MKNIKTYEQYQGQTFKEYLNFQNINLKTTYLSCESSNLIDLDGIEILVNLIGLSCDDNQISSLKTIEKLAKLRVLWCKNNPIDWVDYIDKNGRTYYVKLPKSIDNFRSDLFFTIEEYWKWFDKNQPSGISRKFNF